MRKIPNNLFDFCYLLQKIGFAPIRGVLIYFFLCKGSKIPFISKNVTLIFPSRLFFMKNVWIGQGVYIDACCESKLEFGAGVTIRENSVIQSRSGLNKPGVGLFVGDNVYIGPFAKIGVGGKVKIHNNCQIGAYVSINSEAHILSTGNYTSGAVSRLGIVIEENVWIGDKVTILDGVNIGKNSVIGANSVVNSNIEPNSIYAGVPAKFIKKIGDIL